MRKYILFGLFSLIISLTVLEVNRFILKEDKYDYITRQKGEKFLNDIKKHDPKFDIGRVTMYEFELKRIFPGLYVKLIKDLGVGYSIGVPGGGCYIPKEDRIVLYKGVLDYYRKDWKKIFYEEYLHKKTLWILKKYYFIIALTFSILPILSFPRCRNIRTIDKIAFLFSGFISCYYFWEWIGVVGSLIKYFSFPSLFLSIVPIGIPLWVMIFYFRYAIRVVKAC